MTQKTRLIGLLLVSSALVSACGKKNIEDLPPTASGTDDGGFNNGNNGTIQNAVVPGSQEDFVASVSSDRIFFDTDRFNIDTQDQIALQSQAQWLARYPQAQVTIEGHADERGTRDYNLALGERRANAAKNYLASLGVNPARIRTVSYGKERPDALGSNEQAWAQNRRAVSVIIR
ncbi:peptidoglycan-associated lipoprotein Pal [Sphingorhabdus arenilitoris]|uniref:Peptidoglycan-associated lipoprotein n=1 Tax=Sphingorhabdus arenilitoris TaxID=1490041 RepID=A0ABV8RM28_9SPHN